MTPSVIKESKLTVSSLAAIVCLAANTVMVPAAEMRTWTDNTGRYHIEAKYVSRADGSVTLERADGKQVEIALDRLTEADQKYVAGLEAGMKADDPFNVVGNDASEGPDGGRPKVVEVDWSTAREVGAAPKNSDWKFDAAPAEAYDYPATFRPVPFPRVGFKYEGITVSVPCNRVLLSFARRDKKKYPDENKQIVCRYVLADMVKGEIESFEVGPLDSTMRAVGLNDEGDKALVKRTVWGFGNSDRLEHWSITKSGVKQDLQWIPYNTSKGADRDIKWAHYLERDRAVTVSGGGRLVVWDLTTAEPVYHFQIKGGSVPGISPDRRYICYSRGEDIGVLDVEKGEVVAARRVGSSLTWPSLRFNPTGTKIACLDHTRLKVWDFLSGEPLIDIPKRGFPHGGFRFVSDSHLLISGKALFDIGSQLVIWNYEGAGAAEEYGEYCCFVAGGSSGNPGLIIPERIPQKVVTDTLAKAMADPEFWVLTKGTMVRLELDGLPDDDQREEVRATLTKKLNAQGCQVGDKGTIDLVASVSESEQKKEVSYGRAFGPFARGGVPFKVREFISRVKFVYKGEIAWEQSGTNIPTSFSLKKGEAITEAIERHEKPNYSWFNKLELPLVLRKPTGTPSLGTTKVTAAGLR